LYGADTAINLQKRLLHGVLRIRAISEHMKRDTLHAPGMRGMDFLKGGQIPALRCLNQFGVMAKGTPAGGGQGHSVCYNEREGQIVLRILRTAV
jgi:hypothetical protein